jgi:hypothetical protein
MLQIYLSGSMKAAVGALGGTDPLKVNLGFEELAAACSRPRYLRNA